MIKRTKVTYTNVKIELLGQIRTVEDVNVIIEENLNTGKVSRIFTLEEWNRLEQREHYKIMAKYKNKSK